MRRTQRQHIATILVFGIASLVILVYLALRPNDGISYDLPILSPFAQEEVTSITIEHPEGLITLNKTTTEWSVSPGDYPADADTMQSILTTLSNLTISDVISVADDPARYQLDEANRVRVMVEGGDTSLRVVDIGRRAATIGHTFVRLPNDERILQATGTLRDLFDRNADAFRNKIVLRFDPDSIHTITVAREQAGVLQTVRVIRNESGWALAAGEPSTTLNNEGITFMLQFLGYLSAHRYRYSDTPLGDVWLMVTLVGDETHTLMLYPEQNNLYPARSSGSDEDFEMLLFQASVILEPFGLKE
ncbi:MAG: DUF4340 domain-containing protein [Chloroflexota bacterium]